MSDKRLRLVVPGRKDAEPTIIQNAETGETTAFESVAVQVISTNVLNVIVRAITQNVTANVCNNIARMLKDRCQHEKPSGDLCNIARAAHHVNDHDFTEAASTAVGS